MQWKKLVSIDQIPKDGNRVLIGNFGKTYAQKDELSEPYEMYALFHIDILQFGWEYPEKNEYVLWSQNSSIKTADEILSKYNVFFIIDQPERSKREDLTNKKMTDLCELREKYHHGCCFEQDETQKRIRDLVKMRCSEHCG
jgi:hypothetical protein